jgi:hypothetical protein
MVDCAPVKTTTATELSRRTALRLGVVGTAMALGHPLFVAQGRAENEVPSDNPGPLWTASFDISGCPVSSANVASLSIDRLDFDLKGGGKAADDPSTRAILRFKDVVEVRKEILAWLREATKRKLLRSITVVLTHRDGGKRTYGLHDVFPTRWAHVDIAASSGTVTSYELEVRVNRVEMA